jgi:hypothetical protein
MVRRVAASAAAVDPKAEAKTTRHALRRHRVTVIDACLG